MIRLSSTLRLFATTIVVATTALAPGSAARAASVDCAFPDIDYVVAYQDGPGQESLTGRIEPYADCPTSGWLTKVDGSERIPTLEEGGTFALPLGTRSGEWYLSSYTVGDHTKTYQPIAPYLVRVVNKTAIWSTSPEQYVPYGERVTVSGHLFGWTEATGNVSLPGRKLTVVGQLPDPSPVQVTTDQTGHYTAQVRAFATDIAGTAYFAGDDTWHRASSWPIVIVHARLSARISDLTPAAGQRVKITGKVAPGGIPVWVVRAHDDGWGVEWIRVTEPVMADANGHYTLYYRPDPVGDPRHEIFTPGRGGGLPGGVVGYWKPFNLTIH